MDCYAYEKLYQHLSNYNQEHLLTFWDELDEKERCKLIADIKEIDFATFMKDVQEVQGKEAQNKLIKVDAILQPPPTDMCGSAITSSEQELDNYEARGLKCISNGEYCAILMAGGVGTRLGVSYPKGMYNVGLPSGKSLFQIQAERLLRLQTLAKEKYGVCKPITWYIMTSESTKQKTLDFFTENQYFGLEKCQVVFFEQFTLPVMGMDGKILLGTKYSIAKSPDGNGGLYKCLSRYEILDDMRKRGIEYAFVYGVDNIMVKIADPVFLGFVLDKNVECAAKVVEKVDPTEKVGVVGIVDGKFKVVEYSEINYETANLRDETVNKLVYRCGNICMHLFSVSFLERICCQLQVSNIPQHIAWKKVPSVDLKTGMIYKPEDNNGIKLEKFVFDIFPLATSFAIWEVDRNDEFSPLKNAPGSPTDSPVTNRAALLQYHKRLLTKFDSEALRNILEKNSTLEIEISPLVSYKGEDLTEAFKCLSGATLGSVAKMSIERIDDRIILKL